MSFFQALVLGVLQGLTEFLPISSTAHLVIIPWVFGWPDPTKSMDVALHIGTLLALIVYFRKDLWNVMMGRDRRLLTLVIIGCLPAALVLPVDKIVEKFSDPHDFVQAPLIIGIVLILFAFLLKYADVAGRKNRDLDQMTWVDALIVGFGQTIAAAFPGASRSGTTMTFGLFRGLTRETVVRYSFLMSVPTIAAVALYETAKVVVEKDPSIYGNLGPIAVGILAAGISGYFAVAFLMDYVKRAGMDVFLWYRIALGIAILTVFFTPALRSHTQPAFPADNAVAPFSQPMQSATGNDGNRVAGVVGQFRPPAK